jgi:hypothetical protein
MIFIVCNLTKLVHKETFIKWRVLWISKVHNKNSLIKSSAEPWIPYLIENHWIASEMMRYFRNMHPFFHMMDRACWISLSIQISPVSFYDLIIGINTSILSYFNDVKISIFWDITPCNVSKVNRLFGVICRLDLQGRRISQARNSMKQVARRAIFLWNVDFQRTTRRYIPEDITLRNHRCENLKSYILLTYFNESGNVTRKLMFARCWGDIILNTSVYIYIYLFSRSRTSEQTLVSVHCVFCEYW